MMNYVYIFLIKKTQTNSVSMVTEHKSTDKVKTMCELNKC